MKHILTSLFVFLVLNCNSQVITVKLDTTQFFEHSLLMSTPRAIETGNLTYTDLYEHKPNMVITFDLNNMIESFNGMVYEIVKVNQSTNIIDIIVNEEGQEALIVLGKTKEGGIMCIIEYRDEDMVRGFFSKNPEFTISN